MDILLKRLFKVNEDIVWGNLDETVVFSRFSLRIVRDSTEIYFEITNNGKASEKLVADNFFLSDDNLKKSPLNLDALLIPVKETVFFVLHPSVSLSEMGFLNFSFEEKRLMIALY